jgi:hypothetical protein
VTPPSSANVTPPSSANVTPSSANVTPSSTSTQSAASGDGNVVGKTYVHYKKGCITLKMDDLAGVWRCQIPQSAVTSSAIDIGTFDGEAMSFPAWNAGSNTINLPGKSSEIEFCVSSEIADMTCSRDYY